MFLIISITACHKMLAAMLLNQKAWLASPSISIPMGCHGAGNEIICRRSQNDKPGNLECTDSYYFFFAHHVKQHTQTKFIINFLLQKQGSSRKWPYETSNGRTMFALWVRSFFFFFNNRAFRLPTIVLLIHLSGCMTSVTKPESWSILL